MNETLTSEPDSFTGATAVITHKVRSDKHADYEKWHEEIAPLCKAAPGHLDWHIVRPIPGLSETFTIIIRFDTEKNLREWMRSQTRTRLIDKVQPLLVSGDDVVVSSGLDFWFAPSGAKAKVPVRWKQFLVTWSAIFPLVLGVTMVTVPVLQLLEIPGGRVVSTFVVTGIVVSLMVYLVMPRYTKLIGRWLFR